VNQVKVSGNLEPASLETIYEALRQGETRVVGNITAVPLRVGDRTIGVVYFDRPAIEERDLELVNVLANQAAVAIHNSQLYEMATLDHLTGVYNRSFFEQYLLREVRTAFRSEEPLSLLMIDVDDMKGINDTAGHLAGDQALALLSKVLREATRSTDVIGRYGGDEFAVILPQARLEDAGRVAQRILGFLEKKSVAGPKGSLPLQVSMGMSSAEPHAFPMTDIPRPIPNSYFHSMAQILTLRADEGLYRAKRGGKNQICQGPVVHWQPLVANSPALVEESGRQD
jgi:diguanylate cyclase (GGDEF)-like protein